MRTIFFGYKNGKLVAIIESTVDDYESAIDVDYIITDPKDAEKQISEWRNKNK